MGLKIIRTEHTGNEHGEIRNYFVHIRENTTYVEAQQEAKMFEEKHKPKHGVVNILFFYSNWAARVLDYTELTGADLLIYHDEHPYAYLQGVFLVNPIDCDSVQMVINYPEQYKDMTIKEIDKFLYMESLRDKPEQLRKFIQYENEKENISPE